MKKKIESKFTKTIIDKEKVFSHAEDLYHNGNHAASQKVLEEYSLSSMDLKKIKKGKELDRSMKILFKKEYLEKEIREISSELNFPNIVIVCLLPVLFSSFPILAIIDIYFQDLSNFLKLIISYSFIFIPYVYYLSKIRNEKNILLKEKKLLE